MSDDPFSEAMLIYPRLTKDWINRDVHHPPFATNASTFPIVSSYIFNLPDRLVLDLQCRTVTSHTDSSNTCLRRSQHLRRTPAIPAYLRVHICDRSQLHFRLTSIQFDFQHHMRCSNRNPKPCEHFVYDSPNKGQLFKSHPPLCVICLVRCKTLLFTNICGIDILTRHPFSQQIRVDLLYPKLRLIFLFSYYSSELV